MRVLAGHSRARMVAAVTAPAPPATADPTRDPNAHNGTAAAASTINTNPTSATPPVGTPPPSTGNGYTGIDNGAPLTAADTDADGLTDDFEKLAGTNALTADSDADGLTDGYEALRSHTDPLAIDTDKDGISDAVEVAAGSDAGQIPGI